MFDEDWEFLKHYYEAGPGVAARGIIHAYVARVRAKAEAMLETESGGITKLGDEL